MRLQQIKIALTKTYQGVDRYHMLQMAAAMSYYFVISLFPALIFLSGILAYIPIPHLFNQTLHMTGRFLPADEMSLVQKVLADVILPNRGAFLSFGLLGTVWTASGGLAATIEALNIAYHVEETRPFWRTRPLAVALSFVLGFLLLSALAVMTRTEFWRVACKPSSLVSDRRRCVAIYLLDDCGRLHHIGSGTPVFLGAKR